jgi:hypothetical protein
MTSQIIEEIKRQAELAAEQLAEGHYEEAVIRYWGENAKTNKIMGLL